MANDTEQAKRMVMIGGWNSLYKKAKESGFDLTVIQDKPKPEDLPLIDHIFTLPLDHPYIPDLVEVLHKDNPFDCVVSMNEMGLLTAAIIKERLGIIGNPLQPVRLTRDKEKMREHLSRNHLRTIPHAIVSSVPETLTFAEKCGWPIILKPIMGTGSMQIYKLESPHEVEQALDSIKQTFPDTPVLAEKFLVGTEISVEGFSWNGEHHVIAVTDKLTTGAPYFVEIGHSIPSALEDEIIQEVQKYTLAFLSSIGNQIGPSHTEMIVTEDGPYIIESHTRAGGDFIYELTELAYGVDVFTLTFQGMAGKEPLVDIQRPKGAAIRYLTLPEGTIRSIERIEEAMAQEGIVRCQMNLSPGQMIVPFKNSMERYGWIVAQGQTVKDALRMIEKAMHTITIEME